MDLDFVNIWINQQIYKGILQIVKQKILIKQNKIFLQMWKFKKKRYFYKYLIDGIILQYYSRTPISSNLQKYTL